jgi:CTP synthase
MIEAITFARTNKIPFFGICLGLQCAVIEIARNLANLKRADSEEFNPNTPHPVIFHMGSWYDPKTGKRIKRTTTDARGGTMRLGSYPCRLEPNSNAYAAYKADIIHERHRHRFEVNPDYADELTKVGMVISGQVPENPLDNPSLPKPKLIEIIEVKDHPWFLGCQFHPEFKSNPMNPHPLFKAFIGAALSNSGKSSVPSVKKNKAAKGTKRANSENTKRETKAA